MQSRKCPVCSSEELVEDNMLHVIIEQGNVRFETQQGIEVKPWICKKCGFVMLFKI